jgi:hypothetical protein
LLPRRRGVACTSSDRDVEPLTLVYLYWEPRHAADLPIFAEHRAEVDCLREFVLDDGTSAFAASSHPSIGANSTGPLDKPGSLDAHLVELRRRYDVEM